MNQPQSTMDRAPELQICKLGVQEYESIWREMQTFTAQRTADTPDQLWFLQHPPVYTQGLNGRKEHILSAGQIPVIQVDRGGQVTYHGPGQVVIYLLLDIRRLGMGVRDLVNLIEQSIIELLATLGIPAIARADAPGVYIGDSKIASLGLRVRRGCCYHGLSLNVDMDLSPFNGINPCGLTGLEVTQITAYRPEATVTVIGDSLLAILQRRLAI